MAASFNIDTFTGFNDGKDPSLNPFHYDRIPLETLELQKEQYPYLNVGFVTPLPKNYGDSTTLQRWEAITPFQGAAHMIAKNSVDAGTALQMQANAFRIFVNQYGAYLYVQDTLETLQFVSYLSRAKTELMRAAWETMNNLNREKLFLGGYEYVAGNAGVGDLPTATLADALTATDTISTSELLAIAGAMADNKEMRYDSNLSDTVGYTNESNWIAHDAPINGFGADGLYHVYLSMEAFTSLIENDSLFRDTVFLNFSDKMSAKNHLGIGKAFDYMNLKLIQVPSSQVKSGVNATDIAYQSALILGCGASSTKNDVFVRVMLEGESGIQSIVKEVGSAGTNDPLNLIGSVGVKFWYGSEVLIPAGVASYVFALGN